MQHTVYLFDRFQLDVTRRKLLNAGGLVQRLNSRAMEALLLLVANAGEVVEKQRLMQAIWPHTIVEDNNLNQCILAIRKALGETAGSNQYVMTVPGRGYCFVCPVRKKIQESDDGVDAAPAAATAAVSAGAPASSEAPAAPSTIVSNAAPEQVEPAPLSQLPRQRTFWYGFAAGLVLAAVLLLPLALHWRH